MGVDVGVRERLRLWREDMPWFAANAPLRIRDKTSPRMTDFVFNDAQRLLWGLLCSLRDEGELVRVIIPKSRQMGMTTFGLAHMVWRCVTGSDVKCLFLGHDMGLVRPSYQRVRDMVGGIREEVRPGVVKDKDSFELGLSTGSNILFQSVGKDGVGRGSTVEHLHATEMPSWGDPEGVMTGVHECVPEYDGFGSSIVLESTCEGKGNYWHWMCQQAQAGRGDYKLFFLAWFVERAYGLRDPRKSDLSERKLKSFGLREWSSGCGVPLGSVLREELHPDELILMRKIQDEGVSKYKMSKGLLSDDLVVAKLLWRRRKIVSSGLELFKQEYPSTLEEAFRGTGRPVFSVRFVSFHQNRCDENDNTIGVMRRGG